MNSRYFVDVNGHIWSIDHKGNSNFPGDIQINESDVWVLGAKDDLGPGRLIEDEYTLWPSLTALAMTLEHNIPECADGSVSLDQAVSKAHLNLESFKSNWLNEHRKDPIRWPLVLPENNSGTWNEHINDHNGDG